MGQEEDKDERENLVVVATIGRRSRTSSRKVRNGQRVLLFADR
jgi:hypothetical protein